MIRRLLFVGVLVCVAIAISKARTKQAADKQSDNVAKSSWDSEGGSPAPDPAETATAI